MASGTTNFPAFLQLNYEENGVNARFERDVRSMTQSAEQKFKASFDEVTKTINRALQPSNFTGLGKLDLGTSNFRQAAAEAKLYQESVAATLRTASALAVETGDTTRETKAYIQALAAQNIEADLAVRSANAQVASYTRLQTALDITAAKSSKLAAAQRAIYAEQAAAARVQVSQQNSRNAFTQMVAPNLSGSALNRGATTSALAQREAMDQLRRAEVGAAEGARILEAITRTTGLALDKTSSSARESAQAFIEAGNAQQKLTSEANELRAALDPMFIAQQKFDQEMVRADRLFEQGAISAREYAQAQALARTNIKDASDEIQRQGTAMVNQAKQGTTAGGAVVNSLGSQRFAMIQVGQQLQDITVGFASGQRTATIFAQQLPQLGFALTGFNGKLGALGRLLAGPVGVAIFAAVTVAAFALESAFKDTGDAADKAAKDNETLAESLDRQKHTLEEVTKALEEYYKAQENGRDITFRTIELSAQAAKANLEEVVATREKIKALLELYELEARRPSQSVAGDVVQQGAFRRADELREQLAQNQVELDKAVQNVGSSVVDVATELSNLDSDPTYKIKTGFDLLRESARKSIKDVADLRAELTRLNKAEEAAIKAIQKTNRTTRSSKPVTLDEVTSILERELGAVIGSTSRTRAQNKAAGGAEQSFHLFDQAIDLPFSKGRNAQISKEDIRRVLEAEGIEVKELLGRGDRGHNDHNHVAFGRRRLTGEQIADRTNKSAERAARAAAKETSRLASLSDQAAESVMRVNEQFDDQPRLVDRSAQAVRKLDKLMAELNSEENKDKDGKSKVPGYERIVEDLKEARELAAAAVDTEIGRYAKDNEKNLEIMSLQASGLFDQAEILQEINRLDERLGLDGALEKLTEQKELAQAILADEAATADERAQALGVVEKTTAEIAKIGDQQALIRQEVTDTHEATKAYSLEIRRANEELNDQLDVLGQVENSLTGLLGGQVSGKEFFQDLRGAFSELQAKTSFRSIFGDAFDQIEAELNKDSPLSKANERLVGQVDQTGEVVNAHNQALADAGNAVIKFADVVNGTILPAGSGPVANDNQREIVVSAIRDEMELKNSSVIGLANEIGLAVTEPFARILSEVFGTQFGQMLSGVLASAIGGYSVGGATGGILGGLRGAAFEFGPDLFGKGLNDKLLKGLDGAIAGSGTGTQMAGIAKALGLGSSYSSTGSQIGGAIGSAIPIPGGDIIGSVIGGFLGGLFKKKPKGVSVISGIDGPAAVSGNKGSVRDNLGELSGGIQESLSSIASQFGAEVGDFRVSIGQRKDYFRVSASGSREVDAKKYPRNAGSDLLYDGKDAEEAARIALLNAIQDGAILGIRQGSQRLLQSGKDIEKSVREALDFENVFKRLRQYKDPVGAALDALDKEFDRLIGIFGKAGASAQEYADLEELYGIERAQAVKEAGERITGSLRDLFEDLTIGDSGLSLRSRLGSAQGAYDPLAQRVADGDITAYDDYANAARNLLELQREVYGSSEDYFKLLEEVTNLTKTRIDEETNIASIAVDRDTPFTVDQTPVVNALNYQTELLASYLAAIAKNGAAGFALPSYGGGSSSFNSNVANF